MIPSISIGNFKAFAETQRIPIRPLALTCIDKWKNRFNSLQAEKVDLDKVFLVCIQEELEAWLLVDYQAVTAMLQPLKHPHSVSRISRFSNPDSIRNPKQRLTKIFDQELGPCRRYVDYRHALLIARAIVDFSRVRRSDSFKRLALKVAGLEL